MKNFNVVKLGRKSNPENPSPPQVYSGFRLYGTRMKKWHPKLSELMSKEYETEDDQADAVVALAKELGGEHKLTIEAEDDRPNIGEPLWFYGRGIYDWLQTSVIRSYYVHEDGDNHPDKLVLPSEFPMEDLVNMDMPLMEKGDMLLCTMNSIYFAQDVRNHPNYKEHKRKKELENKEAC